MRPPARRVVSVSLSDGDRQLAADDLARGQGAMMVTVEQGLQAHYPPGIEAVIRCRI